MAATRASTELEVRSRQLASAWIRAYAAGRRLRSSPEQMPLESAGVIRGRMDIAAAWNRWHEPAVAASFTADERPFFALLDRVRVETLASGNWPGMRSNLSDAAALAPSALPFQPIYLCARLLAEGEHERAGQFVDAWFSRHKPGILRSRLARWRAALGMQPPQRGFDPDRLQALASILQHLLEVDAWAADWLVDPHEFCRRVSPLVRLCGQTLVGPSRWSASECVAPAESVFLEFQSETTREDAQTDSNPEGFAASELEVTRIYAKYSVFTAMLDETAPASRWFRPDDTARLERLKAFDRRRARQLAHRLQRRLQVARQRHWEYDQEAGIIDSRRLARLVKAGSDPAVFRREAESPVPEAAVSLLVDLSGSMRGERLLAAAVAIDLAVHVLENCGVRCEVLGYTTRYGEDNPIVRRWQRAGAPRPAGRLNAIRHVIFKPAHRPWRQHRRYLGLLLREGFGLENCDGEALHWAAGRLLQVDVPRRVLVVLSDGAPFDQATADANGREFLGEHLRAVLERLDSLPLQLVAMGTGSDVSRYYRQALMISGPDAVAATLFEHLGDLLTGPDTGRDRQ